MTKNTKIKITVLGCGGSMGVPASGGYWGDCDPKESRNYRHRASILVQSATTNILIDTPADTREQLNRIGLNRLDAVIYTHAHSDHINGLDDLRIFYFLSGRNPVPVYSDAQTLFEMQRRFTYAFEGSPDGLYDPVLQARKTEIPSTVVIGDIALTLFRQEHGSMGSIGLRIGDFAYCTDMVDLPEESWPFLEGVRTWMVDGGGYREKDNPSHASLVRIFSWVERLDPEMTWLTDMTARMDYQTLCRELPEHIRPAYDGLILEASCQ